MTEPLHPQPNENPDRSDDGDAAALDDATVAALRALLRDEPVHDDELARERRIRAALDAAPAAPAAVPAPRRRTGGGGWLVAAAVISVLGVGGYLFVSVAGSGGSDEATSDMAADGSTAEDGAVEDGAVQDADGAGGDVGRENELGADAPTTSAPAPASAAVDADRVIDLGSFDDLDALLAAADGALRAEGSGFEAPFAGDAAPCVSQQRALGLQVVGVAALEARAVVVVREPAGTRVLDGGTCTDLPG